MMRSMLCVALVPAISFLQSLQILQCSVLLCFHFVFLCLHLIRKVFVFLPLDLPLRPVMMTVPVPSSVLFSYSTL